MKVEVRPGRIEEFFQDYQQAFPLLNQKIQNVAMIALYGSLAAGSYCADMPLATYYFGACTIIGSVATIFGTYKIGIENYKGLDYNRSL